MLRINSPYKIFLIAALICVPFLNGCYKKDQKSFAGVNSSRIMIAGSTSVQPIAEKLAEHYLKAKPGVKIEVQGGGSSAGIEAARSGAAQFGSSSRELKEAEKKDLREVVIAYDAIVLILNPKNALKNISSLDARRVFSGEAKNWSDINSASGGAITAITREEGSGTRGAFEELIMDKTEITPRCLVQDSTGALREIVSEDKNAIGYISFGALNDRVRALAVDGVEPLMSNMIAAEKKKRYKIIRPFLFAYKGEMTPAMKEFIDFIRSADGAALLKQEGLIPLNE